MENSSSSPTKTSSCSKRPLEDISNKQEVHEDVQLNKEEGNEEGREEEEEEELDDEDDT